MDRRLFGGSIALGFLASICLVFVAPAGAKQDGVGFWGTPPAYQTYSPKYNCSSPTTSCNAYACANFIRIKIKGMPVNIGATMVQAGGRFRTCNPCSTCKSKCTETYHLCSKEFCYVPPCPGGLASTTLLLYVPGCMTNGG